MEITNNDEKRWRVLGSEYLIRRPWLTARRDRVMLPDGRVNDEYYVLEYPDWINVIALTRDGMMVMERQYRHGLGRTCYEIPAGIIEPGETPLQAAQRELLEETGYAGGQWEQVMSVSQNSSTSTNLTYSFVARDVEPTGKRHLDATEDIEVLLMSPEEVYRLLEGDEIKQALMAAPLWRFFFESAKSKGHSSDSAKLKGHSSEF
ncbi:MAG: NUDIX hydrolase [Muribaculaceae bacterium]